MSIRASYDALVGKILKRLDDEHLEGVASSDEYQRAMRPLTPSKGAKPLCKPTTLREGMSIRPRRRGEAIVNNTDPLFEPFEKVGTYGRHQDLQASGSA